MNFGGMIEIKDISGKTRFSTSINKGAKGKFTLMKEDYIILPFSVPTPIPFKLGDYVDLSGVLDESLGGKLAKIYEITDLQKPTYNSSTGGYDYELQMNAYYWKWKNKVFKYTPEHAGNEASWSLTASLDVQLGVFLRNLKALGYTYKGTDFTFSIDDTVENKAIAMTYDNINLLDALFSMAGEDKWNCDCWITDNIIHFGRNEFGDAVKIERGVEASDITRSESEGTYATRIYAFGSTKNIPTNYRPTDEQVVVNGVAQKRLMLPSGTPYIDAYEGMSQEEAIEDVVVFDDVYPRRVGTLSDVHTRTEEVENEDGTKETITYYRYKDTGLEFKEEYILESEELKIQFQSGKLNGMEFGVIFNPKPKDDTRGDQLWEIVRNEDYGRPLPDEIIRPENGDEYVLSGFNIQLVSDQYIQIAEQELKEKAQKYADKVKKDDGTYHTTLMSDWVHEDPISRIFEFGQRINLVDDTYFENGRISRVLGWEMNLDVPWDSPVYTIGESMPYSRIGKIEDKVDALTYRGHTYTGGGGSGVYVIKVNDSISPSDSNVFSALRSIKEFISKQREDSAQEKIHFLKGADFGHYNTGESGATVDGDGNAEWLTAVIRELLRSLKFVDGMTGEGWQLWMDALTGLSNLTIDKVTIRQTLVALELLIQKVRSIGGQFVVSAASGKIKTVAKDGDNYKITFEQDNEFVANDLMRCAEFTGTSLRGYWVEISSSDGNGITVPVSEFGGVEPKEGDECVLMGNTQNRLRQNLISIAATEDGQPRVDVLDGVCAKNFNDCLRVRLGNLDGISDNRFPANNQPHGNGLYGDNVYLMGTFVLTTGEDILTRFEITEGKIEAAVEGLRKDFTEDKSYLDNASFGNGMNKWDTENEAIFFLLGSKWIWANGAPLSDKTNYACVKTDDGRTTVYIRNKYILQKHENFRFIPDYTDVNDAGQKKPEAVYLSFFYRVAKSGRLTINFEGLDKTGFENFNEFSYDGELGVTDGYQIFNNSGLWNGTGDFKLSFTGEIYLYMLVLSTDRAEALAYKYKTLFEQSEKLVKIAAANFDKDGNVIESSSIVTTAKYNKLMSQYFDENGQLKNMAGLVTSSDFSGAIDAINENFGNYVKVTSFAGLFAQEVKNDSNIVKQADISVFITENEAGELISKAQIRADQIDLKGAVTFESFNSSLKDTINGKADSSSLGTLAYKNNIAKDLLNADLSNLIDGKMNSSDAGKLAYVDSVEAAQLGSTIIVGGYLNTDYIKVNRIDAQGARVGGFTIDSGRLHWKANDYLGGDSRSLKLGSSSSNTDGVVDVAFNAATTGRFGVKAVGSNSGGAAIYASTGTLTYPGSSMTYAGFFVGSTSVRGELDSDCCASKGFRFITGRNSDGTYTYNEGVNWGNGAAQNPDLDKIRLIVRGGIIVGYTGE